MSVFHKDSWPRWTIWWAILERTALAKLENGQWTGRASVGINQIKTRKRGRERQNCSQERVDVEEIESILQPGLPVSNFTAMETKQIDLVPQSGTTNWAEIWPNWGAIRFVPFSDANKSCEQAAS